MAAQDFSGTIVGSNGQNCKGAKNPNSKIVISHQQQIEHLTKQNQQLKALLEKQNDDLEGILDYIAEYLFREFHKTEITIGELLASEGINEIHTQRIHAEFTAMMQHPWFACAQVRKWRAKNAEPYQLETPNDIYLNESK